MTIKEMQEDLLRRLYESVTNENGNDFANLNSAVNAFNFAMSKAKDGD